MKKIESSKHIFIVLLALLSQPVLSKENYKLSPIIIKGHTPPKKMVIEKKTPFEKIEISERKIEKIEKHKTSSLRILSPRLKIESGTRGYFNLNYLQSIFFQRMYIDTLWNYFTYNGDNSNRISTRKLEGGIDWEISDNILTNISTKLENIRLQIPGPTHSPFNNIYRRTDNKIIKFCNDFIDKYGINFTSDISIKDSTTYYQGNQYDYTQIEIFTSVIKTNKYIGFSYGEDSLSSHYTNQYGSIFYGYKEEAKSFYLHSEIGIWAAEEYPLSPIGNLEISYNISEEFLCKFSLSYKKEFLYLPKLYERDYTITKYITQSLPPSGNFTTKMGLEFGEKTKVKLNTYFKKISEYITISYDNINYFPDSIDSLTVIGTQEEVNIPLIKDFLLFNTNFTYEDYRYEKSSIKHLPFHSSCIFSSQLIGKYKKLKTMLETEYRNKQWAFSKVDTRLSSIFLVNFGVEYNTPVCNFYGKINNIFNRKYEIRKFYPADSRLIIIGIDIKF